MSIEITTEVLAKAIDETKDVVRKVNVDGKFLLNIKNEDQDYKSINK